MQIAHLEAFLAVVEEKTFAAAARRLWVAPSRITERVQQLERELNCVLIDRTNRTLELTQAGLALVPRAQAVVREVEAIRALFPEDGTRDIRVGMRTMPRDFRERIHELIARAAPDHSLTVLPLDTTAQLHLLQTGRLDFGFIWTPPPAPLQSLPVLREDLYVALPATDRFAQLESVQPSDLIGLKLASTVDPLKVPAQLAAHLEYLPHTDIVNAAVEGALSLLVQSGRYCTIATKGMLTDHALTETDGRMLIRPLLPPPSLTTHFTWNPELEQQPPFANVITHIRRIFRRAELR